jgi:ferredoxin
MEMASARLIYFSPTQTTRKIVEAIARGARPATLEHIDLTPPQAISGGSIELDGEPAIIGCPVYTGRVPLDMIARLRRIKGRDTPAVVVVVYGNRAYEDALRELRDLAVEAGFKPFAAGAFIGEHSYSTAAALVAAGRPDAEDLRRAGEFGCTIHQKIRNHRSSGELDAIHVPGNFPYKERGGLANIAPVTDPAACTLCGTCATVCPTAAIAIHDAVITDPGKCIRCCACVKICADGARSLRDERIRQVAEQLSRNCGARKEPEVFL